MNPVYVHTTWFPDLNLGVYTVALVQHKPPHKHAGEAHAAESWIQNEDDLWIYAGIHTVLAAVEHGYDPDTIVVRGDCLRLSRLMASPSTNEKLRGAQELFWEKYPGLRFQHRAFGHLSIADRDEMKKVMRSIAREHLQGVKRFRQPV